MNERRQVSGIAMPTGSRIKLLSAVASIAILSIAVAGCGSSSSSRAARSEKAEIDPKLGVAPSPRVVKPGQAVPKGGGRAIVGRPYTVGGKRYVPRIDPGYEKVGLASWYGDAFHGRRTANGEIFDANHLSAAHPTMPLPSYARVTSLTTGRSVMVRVNDRGPFHSNRLIDISRRTADVLGVRAQGIARVKVEYVGPAPTEGDDTRTLMASLRGTDSIPSAGPGETLMAAAGSLPGVAAAGIGSTFSAAAGLFSSDDAPERPVRPTLVAAAPKAPVAAPSAVAAAAPVAAEASLTAEALAIAGDVLPPVRPMVVEEVYVLVASADPADAFMGAAVAAPIQVAALTPAPVAALGATAIPAGFTVGAQPVAFQSEATGTRAPMPSSYAADRIAQAYAAVSDVGEGVALSDLANSLAAMADAPTRKVDGATLEVGVFANPANVRRLAETLGTVGTVSIDALTVGGKPMQRVRVTALTVADGDAIAAASRAGVVGARILR